MNTYLLFE